MESRGDRGGLCRGVSESESLASRQSSWKARKRPLPEQTGKGAAQGMSGLELTGRLTEVAADYQQILKKNPKDVKALLGMGLVAVASGQTEAAIKMAGAAVRMAPRMGTAWVTLGQALKAAGRLQEAETAYREAISLDGMDPLARQGLGELRLAEEKGEQAVLEFDLALRRMPMMPAALMGMGNALAMVGRNEEAYGYYEKLLGMPSPEPEAEFSAAFVLSRMGRTKEAIRYYRRAVRRKPDFASAWMNLGCLLHDEGHDIYAESALQRAVELRPDMVNGWLNLALLERGRKQPEKAEEYLRKAFALNPEFVDTAVTWCQLRSTENDQAGAWAWLRWALLREPEHAEALNMQGILLHKDLRTEEAIACFARAEALGHRAATSNRANVLLDLGRMAEALAAHKKAAADAPDCAGARYNLALTRLRMGEWKEGWPEYEARWRFREVHSRQRVFRQPRWTGEPLHGEAVLLHAEQGLGDSIQFSRFAALVAARGGRPLVMVQQQVERLMAGLDCVRNGTGAQAITGRVAPKFDYECPLMSLPAVFGTTMETVPWSGAYLGAEPDLIREKWRQVPRSGAGPRVGIAWAGNPRYKADAHRSMKLETMLPLLETPGFEWISLQKDGALEQIASLPERVRVIDGSSREENLAETAALIETLDMVVTTDTCIAHLAGALAKPVWILLPHLSDWRWMQEIETTPWYPTARLVRQRRAGDWADVLGRVAEAIEAFRREQETV
jgi:tetratricopeptide (TPR) repeat protein